MNYLPFVSWGVYGGASADERADFFSSWGLFAPFPDSGITPAYVKSIMDNLFNSIIGG